MAFSGTFDSNGYPIDTDTNAGDTGWHICDGTNGTPDLLGGDKPHNNMPPHYTLSYIMKI